MATPVTPAWQLWRDRRGRISALRIATLLFLLLPLAKAVIEAGDIVHGARPLNEMIHRAGFWALVFLGVTLAVTPFRRIFRYGNLIDVRRMLDCVARTCYIGSDFDRRHGATARRSSLAAFASGDLRDRAARAHSLFPADQG
jgi:hypothetical protein